MTGFIGKTIERLRPGGRGPLTDARYLSPLAAARYRRRLRAIGLRTVPYPFRGAMAIVSDVDGSRRADYEQYARILVAELGLDFGDSCHLIDRSGVPRSSDALTLFSSSGALRGVGDTPITTRDGLSGVELLREFHRGNVDHYHGLSAAGGRVVCIRPVERRGAGRWVAPVDEVEPRSTPPFNFRADHLPVLGVTVLASGPLPPDTTLRLAPRGGQTRAVDCQRATVDRGGVSAPGRTATWFDVPEERGRLVMPHVADLDAVEIAMSESGGAALAIDAVCLTNLTRDLLDRTLAQADALGFRTNLITDHGCKLFASTFSEREIAAAAADRLDRLPRAALFGRLEDDRLAFSTLGDDPESITYVLDRVRDAAGIRFINAGGLSGEPVPGFDCLHTVVPAPARDGSWVYLARRFRTDLTGDATVPEPLRRDVGTRSFGVRLERLLDEHRRRPGRLWPMYIHLGNIAPKRERPSPYLAPAPLERLQNAVLGIDPAAASGERMWLTRASILYDYALMVRSIAPHVERSGPDTIHIRSWEDPILGRRLPESAGQLNGLTLYVGDPDRAEVFLDGRPIHELTRNGPDETGRPSVTIVGAGIRHIALDDVDHVGMSTPDIDEGLAYEWREEPAAAFRGRCFAELRLDAAGTRQLLWRPDALNPVGCQHLAFAVRRGSPTARLALRVGTVSGGTFLFGHATEPVGGETPHATYVCGPGPPGQWTLHVVPFYDLTWRAGSRPGGPLPSHAIETLGFVVSGEAGDRVAVDRVEFLRPRTVTGSDETCVVGGRVRGARRDGTVTLAYTGAGGDRVVRRDGLVDDAGFFAFTGIPRGAWVTVTARAGAIERSRTLDVWGNDMTIEVDLAAATAVTTASPSEEAGVRPSIGE